MNGHLTRFCGTRDVTFTRSRPYQGNDNPHVEEKGEGGLLNRLSLALHLMVNWFLPSQKLLRGVRTGSHITKVEGTAQTPCARIPVRKDVAEQTKEHLRATRAGLDMTSLLHEIFVCQEQLDEIARRRQPLVIKKRGSYATISGESTT